ncbi:MAG: SIMPL domain-containing protein [bacterium]|nr:SIMPL domain-containing protein [bacterium]
MENKTINVVIISVAVVLGAFVIANGWVRSKQQNQTITVTGSAQQDFISDLIVWNGYYSRNNYSLQDANAQLKADAETIKKYLIKNGVKEMEIKFSAVNIQKTYKTTTNSDYSRTEAFDGYNLSQTVTVESKNVDKLESLSREVTQLIDQGIELTSETPSYLYTKLADLKHELISNATKDANARAFKVATKAGSGLGKLRKADLGIFQITGQNSTEDYTYGGAYNTSSKNKTITVTVKLQFGTD